MATLILRPSANGSVRHTASNGNAYTCINEATADNDSTYISQTISSTSSASATSTFALSGFLSGKKLKLKSATITYVSKYNSSASGDSASVRVGVSSEGQSYNGSTSTPSTYYGTKTVSVSDVVVAAMSAKTEQGTIPSVTLSIYTAGAKAQSKNTDYDIRVTQAYVTIEYEEIQDPEPSEGTGLVIKDDDGTYKKVYRVLVKGANGYVEQAVTDLDSLFKDGTIYLEG